MFLLVCLTVPALAQEASPIEGAIQDPVYIDLYDGAITPQNKDDVQVYFQPDSERCRTYYGDNYYVPCRQRLGLEGQKAEAGITMDPPVEGSWRWEDDYTLRFTPEHVWPAGQNYKVSLDLDKLRVPNIVVFGDNRRRDNFTVRTQTLRIDIKDMTYMQDPDDPARKVVTASLAMNYPVTEAALKSKIALVLEEAEGETLATAQDKLAFELTVAPDHLSANLAVPLKTLPEQDQYLQLKIAAGVAPEFGGATSGQIFEERALVPSLSTYLQIKDPSSVIARSESGVPEQILSLTTNVKLDPKALHDKVKLYLLPYDHPVMKRTNSEGQKQPYQWKASNEVTPAILEQSAELTLKAMPEGTGEITDFGFQYDAPEGRFIYVSVEKGLKAFGGYTLEHTYENIVNVPAYPHDLEIMQQGSILSLNGSQKLSLHARGTDKLRVEIAQIMPAALSHFIAQTEGDIRTPSFKGWTFNESDIAHIDTQDIQMAYVNPAASQYAALDFKPYLEDDKKGIFLITIQGEKGKNFVGSSAQRFVLVTDLGLLIKKNADQTQDVFLTSFSSGTPVKSAEIKVLGRNGLPVFTGSTDRDGHLVLPDFSGFERDRQPVAITAEKSGDYAFIPYDREDRKVNLSSFEVGGTQIKDGGLNAYLFSDRGIYRPGEEAHIGMIIRNASAQDLPDGLPLKAVITDPRGRVAKEELISYQAPGLAEISLQTNESGATGTYTASLYIANDGMTGDLLGSVQIRVEDFQPDRLKIKTEFKQGDTLPQGWLKPDALAAHVTLTNLYGTAASKRDVKANVTLNPAHIAFKDFPAVRFFDPYAAPPKMIQYALPAAITDEKGAATIALELDRQAKATYSLTLETSGYEAGSGKGVTAYSTALVSPMDYIVGVSTDANLGYLKKDGSYALKLIALDPDLSAVEAKDLSLVLTKQTYVSTLVKRKDGSYVYEAVAREADISTKEFSIPSKSATLSLPSDQLGDFIYRVKTSAGLVVSETRFSVAGEGQRVKGLDKETVLKLKIDKAEYNPGDEIELNISAPYTGTGLITLESDHVLAYKWFTTDKTETIQSIAIPKDFAGKGYISVAFVRDINSREIYNSPLSYAVVPFTANTEDRKTGIELSVAATAKPGEPLAIKYKAAHPGKALIFAIDEGILQVAKYQTPNPIDYFLLNRALQVETSQMLDLLMPEYDILRDLSAHGGDAALETAVLGKHLNPFKRKVLAPAVYWSGLVDVGPDEQTLSFTPPGHFNGTLRVMAVAVAENRMDSATQDVTVRSDLVVTPNLPLFLAPGDEVVASATIANTTDKPGDVAISVTPSEGMTVTKAPTASLPIAAGSEESVAFTLKATDTLGAASVIVTAKLGDLAQDAEATLSIRPASTNETTLTSGFTKDGSADITKGRLLYPEFAEKTLSVSPLPMSYVYGLLRYLDEFPYGCSEQIISRIYPQLTLRDQPEFAASKDDMQQTVQTAIDTLRQRQSDDGGFSMWGGGYQADGFISVYALDFLIAAQEAGLAVPESMVQQGLQYLRSWTNRNITNADDARNKAYGIYVLTRSGIVTTNEILHWLRYFEDRNDSSWTKDLSAVYIAASYQMMRQDKLAAQTIDAFTKSSAADDISFKNWNSSPYHSPFITYAQYVTLLARHFPQKFEALDRNIIYRLADFIDKNLYNTLSASFAIQALSDYSTAQGDALSKADITVKADDQTLPLSGNAVLTTGLPLEAKTLHLNGNGEALFYTMSETGYSRDLSEKPLSDGMEITRSYQTLDGKPVTGPLQTGDVIEALITVRAYENAVANAAIIDLLPGALMLEPADVPGSTLSPAFVERREDRILIFADIATEPKTYRYRLRAVSKGAFTVPPPYAESMYDLSKRARGAAQTIRIGDDKTAP